MLIDDSLVEATEAILSISFHFWVNPDGAVVTTAFQVVNGPKNGHMSTQSWGEMRDDPMNIQVLWICNVVETPGWVYFILTELNDFFKTVDFELISTLDERFFVGVPIWKVKSAVTG